MPKLNNDKEMATRILSNYIDYDKFYSLIYEAYRYKGSSRNLKSQKEWESFVVKVKKMTTKGLSDQKI